MPAQPQAEKAGDACLAHHASSHGEPAPVLYIAGDVHLGEHENPFPRFLDLLATRPPAHLILLGDLFEWWLDDAQSARRHAVVLERLRGLVGAGWRLDLVRGNREIAAGRRLEAEIGARLHWPAFDLLLGPRRVRVVHGDRLCHDPGYRLYAAIVASLPFRAWQRLHPTVIQESVATALRWGSQRRRSQRPVTAAQRQRPRVFIDRRKVQGAARCCDSLIAGHIHQQWHRHLGGIDTWLVGDWSPDTGRWIEGFADGALQARTQQWPGET